MRSVKSSARKHFGRADEREAKSAAFTRAVRDANKRSSSEPER
jgi:hypothetical protein